MTQTPDERPDLDDHPRPDDHPRRVSLHQPADGDAAEFLAAAAASRELHHPWVFPPHELGLYRAYLLRSARRDHAAYLLRETGTGELVGVVNLNHLVWSGLCSGYLGYYAFVGGAGRGLMAEGVRAVVAEAFGPLQLHRVEANIQPGNQPSTALVRRCGFRYEGFSPRYLKVGGQWRDHERWALTREEVEPGARDG